MQATIVSQFDRHCRLFFFFSHSTETPRWHSNSEKIESKVRCSRKKQIKTKVAVHFEIVDKTARQFSVSVPFVFAKMAAEIDASSGDNFAPVTWLHFTVYFILFSVTVSKCPVLHVECLHWREIWQKKRKWITLCIVRSHNIWVCTHWEINKREYNELPNILISENIRQIRFA